MWDKKCASLLSHCLVSMGGPFVKLIIKEYQSTDENYIQYNHRRYFMTHLKNYLDRC